MLPVVSKVLTLTTSRCHLETAVHDYRTRIRTVTALPSVICDRPRKYH